MSELVSLAQTDAYRFRGSDDWFMLERAPGLVTARVGASAERIVDLWHALLIHLAPAVDMRITDVRTGRVWAGAFCALPDVRETIGRLRLSLAAYGGVEVAVFTDSDQLTLTPEMLLVIYARTDRWAFLLDGMGVLERPAMPAPTWWPSRATLGVEPSLEEALQAAADRLGLDEVTE